MSNIDERLLEIRQDFPVLNRLVYGKPLVYLDNAATTQKPKCVISAISDYYLNYNSNIHRGVHRLSQEATDEYEKSRKIIKEFINAKNASEIIFTRGTTEGINLVANSFVRPRLNEGDEVLITYIEHHSNIVPWQIVCEETGAKLKVAPINDAGELVFEEFEKLLTEKVKFVSVVYVSNSLGTINPIEEIIKKAHSNGIPVLIDAAQAIQHIKIDVRALGCDFLVFSGHKIYGPTGIGVLYGKEEHLEKMRPYQGGGDMIKSVSFERTIYNDLPYKFEAGTPNIEGAIGLGKAIEYVDQIGFDFIVEHESQLLKYAHEKLSEIDGLKIIGTASRKASVVSFVLDNVHPHDVGTMLDVDGVAVRTGHHCTEPIMRRFGVPATTRASFAFYNTRQEIDILAQSIQKVIKMFS
ncbi:MAG TPA: cysteine desulfurase [Candidatus Kapabacteria bacterium]|nr:cysteine desulfurase [Candidatus Kapabacteria bacterium]HPP40254.1 cysteine desulfurase [Candidatus Kapabacteria bacterium]